MAGILETLEKPQEGTAATFVLRIFASLERLGLDRGRGGHVGTEVKG